MKIFSVDLGMQLTLQRYSDNRQSTQGLLFKSIMKGSEKKLHLMCYTLEDEYRDEKVMAETRIPAGLYEVDFNKADTPLTKKYKARFPGFFTYHLEVKNVKGFTGVYLHLGNSDLDSMGCILTGDAADNNSVSPGTITNSTIAFTRVYKEIAGVLEAGEKVFIEIRDENRLL